ncbi:E3 Ubiquitin ligase [Nocardiopsis flavescens]|uniref:RING-type E3 ubiquitin transferase n=1 Tax=Nocardiopsis flavescens TaxID=758803 RepID=A0A1M6CEW4_9ACTN|nr:GIDE domain-containing protein [Nocardiopsis flavescens]SHI59532.1 E3 Ubiquitin ligase [Nocardiopsis flavescens]
MDDAFVGEARTAFQLLSLLATALSGFLLRRTLRGRPRLRELREALAPPLRDLPPPGAAVLVGGTVAAGPSGRLRAPYSGARCVWYRTEEWEYRTSAGGRYGRARATLVGVRQSRTPFVIRDRTGSVRCYPRGAAADRIPATHDSFEPEAREEPWRVHHGHAWASPEGRPGRAFREWALAPGTRVVVHATVYTWDGSPVIASAPDGRLLLSTRTAPQVREAHGLRETVGWAAFLGALGALAWSVLG